MATTLKTLRWGDLAVGITIFVLAALTGCSSPQASQSRTSAVAMSTPSLSQPPAPSFDGPNIVARPSVAVAPSAKPHATVAPVSGPAAWKPRVAPRDWKWIVIHHSATPSGSMAFFDKEHKAKGWDGVGYHFVIGNGTESGDGQIEVTQRWPLQKWGAHAKTVDNRYNEQGIGICLVGNFDVERPSPKQMQSLGRLVAHLSQTYRISPQSVVGHRDTKPTDCPGRFMNLAAIRSAAAHASAEGEVDLDALAATATTGTFEFPIDPAPAQAAAATELLMEMPH